ncbi:hypothetical protein FisN_8Lh117 [Fistulifera solaris]|uniref:DUF6824 domain-containing protein n=1 Tax=Fistulifera solaris TaxID=1519565 RepID=A0A1Z5JDG9_FISSO|nr:hypothetical protein FisN_8Lh117 [Fistulifera solaris]|eukprot:GAX12019.1 hypothetical protein FisN_8Lh117 [Fistulifera solaris]
MSYPQNAFFPHKSLYVDQDRKRQRRLTAGAFASVVFGGHVPPPPPSMNHHRRPLAVIPPRYMGPVTRLNKNDVISGRGGRINAHVGNVQFREIVAKRRDDYRAHSTKKLEKAHIAAEIVYFIRSMDPPGRFLKEDPDGSWYDIGDEKAIKKVGQALREDAILAKQKAVDDAKSKESSLKECLKGENNPLVKKPESEIGPTKAYPSVQPQRIVAISSRGAKRVINTTRSMEAAEAASSVPFEPLTYTTKSGSDFSFPAPVPVKKEALTSKSSSSLKKSIRNMFRGRGSGTLQANGVSTAAAAAMNDVAEEAFGRRFHPAQNDVRPAEMQPAEPSLISGLSSLSDWSHPNVPPTSFESPWRSNQEQQQESQTPERSPQHLWNVKNLISFGPRLSNPDGSEGDLQNAIVPGSPDSVQEALLMSYFQETTTETRGRNLSKSQGKRSRSYGSGRSRTRTSDSCDQSFLPRDNDSVHSLPASLPGSILSDLSESLMALDLGDAKGHDIFVMDP